MPGLDITHHVRTTIEQAAALMSQPSLEKKATAGAS